MRLLRHAALSFAATTLLGFSAAAQTSTLTPSDTLITAPIAVPAPGNGRDVVRSSEIEKPSRDFVMVQLTYEGWANKPDSVKTGGIGRGFNAYLCYDFPIKNSHLSAAVGIGVGTSNIYLDNQEMRFTDTGALGGHVRFLNESTDYKKYKVAMTYIEAPLELRYFSNISNRNKGFKAAIGFRAGALVGAHVKDVRTVDGNKIVDKLNTKRYFDKWRFSGTLRVGYGNFSLFGSYNINALFAEGSGPDITPYSAGICLTGL